jgi:serine/threonine-protein kinase
MTTQKPEGPHTPGGGDPADAYVAAEPDLQPGDQVGEYVVEGKLGEGGFGAVFKASHPLIGKQVAVKVLNRQFSSNPQMVSRFIAEARAVNQIRHRHIIDIFAFGQLPDGRQYYVMELLQGEPLDQYLGARGKLTLTETVPILRAVGRALDAAHAKGIAHRDLKPENIFIAHDDDGTPYPKLLDFGIAKLLGNDAPHQHKTRTGAPMGTPYYMSPEQCRGRDVDHRTDIYSFGILSYQLLTGRLPFDGEDFMDILLKQLQEPPVPPAQVEASLPAGIDKPILWMMEKDPSRRPPNLVTAVRSLEEAAAAAGVAVPGGATAAMEAQRASGVVPVPTPSIPTPRPTPGPAAPGKTATADTMLATDTMASPTKSRAGLVIALAGVLLIGGGVTAYVVKGGGRATEAAPVATAAEPAAPPAPTPEPTVTPPVAAADAAPVAPPPPAQVTLTVKGAPDGAQVLGADGQLLGTLPAPISLGRDDVPVTLTFKAKGYKPHTETLVPSGDRELEIKMEKAGGRKPGPRKPGKDDLEDFGN